MTNNNNDKSHKERWTVQFEIEVKDNYTNNDIKTKYPELDPVIMNKDNTKMVLDGTSTSIHILPDGIFDSYAYYNDDPYHLKWKMIKKEIKIDEYKEVEVDEW